MKNKLLFLCTLLLPLLFDYNATTAQNIPDFLVNEQTSIDGSKQSSPDIDCDGQGNYVITWMDHRNGTDFDIYAQIFLNDSTPLSNNFIVSDDGGTSVQYNPAIAVDYNSNFVITWMDKRNGEWDIYTQRFSNSGAAMGSNFKVNEEPGNEEQADPGISIDSCGNFVIVWADEKSGDWDIYGQRYSADGTALGGNFKINDDAGFELQYWPACMGDKNGNIIVSWVDKRYNDDYDIYAQRFLQNGTPQGNNFKVSTDAGISLQLLPDIAIDENGNFIIAWEDKRNGNWDIYAQRYLNDGTTVGNNFKMNDDTPVTDQQYPTITGDLFGNFVVCWEDDRNEYTDIYAQRFASDATPLGINFQVNTDTINSYQYFPEIAADEYGNFMITWEDYQLGFNGDIFSQSYINDGTATGENNKVNDDTGSENQFAPSIAKDSSDNFIIAWIDNRNGFTDIYAQRFSGDGTVVGNNFKVNDDTSAYEIYDGPSAASDPAGNFVITWVDYRNELWGEIYAQRYSGDGTALGSNFKVNNPGANVVYGATAACKKNGGFIIIWGDTEDGGKDPLHFQYLNNSKSLRPDLLTENKGSEPDIWAQQYLSDGTLLGVNFKVNDDAGDTEQVSPAIAIDSSGNFIIIWQDNRNGDWDIYLQRYLSDGTPIGSNIKVLDSLFIDFQSEPSLSSDDVGNFIIAWKDKRNGDFDIWAQRYHFDGSPLGYNFLVNDDNGSTYQSSSCISADGSGKFIIFWTDRRNGNNDVYAQRYLNSGIPFGGNYRISDTSDREQSLPSVVLGNDRINTTWQDNRTGQTGYDVYANVFDWGFWVGTEYKIPNEISPQPCLNQNYPNPFSSFTKISYTIKEAGFVDLTIYNMQSRKIKSLVSNFQSAGDYTIVLDGNEFESGIYFYQLKAENEFLETKKMILMR
jgi:hypothetical protein